MRRFIIRVLFFFTLVGLIDVGFGCVFDFMNSHAKGGSTMQTYNLCMKDQYDIIIMGSSRAHHHYIPSIISDSLGLICYNAGYNGNGILLSYGLYGLIIERYKPRLIIYDVEPAFDIREYENDNGYTRYLSLQKPFYRHSSVSEVIKSVSEIEYIKTHSALFRYNGKISVLFDFLANRGINKTGYEPLTGQIKTVTSNGTKPKPIVYDTLKLHYMREFIKSTKENGIPLIIIASPLFSSQNSSALSVVKNLCTEFNVPFYDYYQDSLFLNNRELFKEPMHLNDKGAVIYTKHIIPVIRNALQ